MSTRTEVYSPGARSAPYADKMSARYGYISGLDGLRAISILFVMFAHLVNHNLFPGGLGVLIFFVISGFLITRLLIAEYKATAGNNLKKFYLRRILRLYPAVVVFVAIVSLCYLLFAPERFSIAQPLSALFYFANYPVLIDAIGPVKPDVDFGHFWSLSLEEQYYVVFPTIFLFARTKSRGLLLVALAGCLLPLGMRLAYVAVWPDIITSSSPITYYHWETRIDSIAFGVMIAAACEMDAGRRIVAMLTKPLPVIVAVLTMLACLLFRDPFFRETFRYTFLQASVAVVLCAVVFGDRGNLANRVLDSRLFVWIGQLSYSLYVWHLVSIPLTKQMFGGWPVALQDVSKFGIAFALAAASYYGPERLARAWRSKFSLA